MDPTDVIEHNNRNNLDPPKGYVFHITDESLLPSLDGVAQIDMDDNDDDSDESQIDIDDSEESQSNMVICKVYETAEAVRSAASEAVSKGKGVSENHLHTSSKVSSAMAGAQAEVTAKSVLWDLNQGAVLESPRRRQSCDSDDES
ncbi:hypothetical protein Tco_0754683 [Tanacetum coccineum]